MLKIIHLCWLGIIATNHVQGKTQSNVIDDCPTCQGVACPSEVLVYDALPEKDFLSSPNFPENYADNEYCRWMIVANQSWQVVRIQIHESHIRSSIICKEDYLYIQDGGELYSKELRNCCQDKCRNSGYITSKSQRMRLTFRSDGYRNDIGFNLTYWAVTKDSTEIKAPTYTTVNYILFSIFSIVIVSIATTLLWVTVTRKINKKVPDYLTPHLTTNKSHQSLEENRPNLDAKSTIDNDKLDMLKRRTHVRKTRLDPSYFSEEFQDKNLPRPSKDVGENIILNTF